MNAALRFAFRSLRRTPGFTILAIAILTLGIGATTAMFSITDSVLLKPLAYRNPGQLVSLMLRIPAFEKVADKVPLSAYQYRFLKEHSRTLSDIALIGPTGALLSDTGRPIPVQGLRVTPNLFDLLGVQPRLGRSFLPQEANPGKNQVIILSDALWRQQFNADPHVLGRRIRLNGREYTVVGVTAPYFPFPTGRQLCSVEPLPEHIQYWTPLAFSEADLNRPDGNMNYIGLARLNPGVSLLQAHTELAALVQAIVKQLPHFIQMYPVLEPLRTSLTSGVRQPLLLLFGAVAFVLLIVCINLMNLMLVRATARRREWAVRLAVGAGTVQLFRDAAVESLLLCSVGGALGIILAVWLVALVRATVPFDLPRVDELYLHWQALAFALGASALSVTLFGFWPAWRSTRVDPQEALQSSGRTATEGKKGYQTGRLLVTAEVALSVVVLLGAGLVVHSFVRLLQVNPGVRVQHLMAAGLQLPPNEYKKADRINGFYRRLLDEVSKLPGIQQAGITSELPLTSSNDNDPMTAADRPLPPLAEWAMVNSVWASSTYFAASGIPLKEGRIFHESDGDHRVVVISQNLAERLWPHESAIGHALKTYPPDNKDEPYRIIGVVGTVHASALAHQAENIAYFPYWQEANTGMTLVVRTAGDPRSVAGAIRRAVAQIDPQVPVFDIRTMQNLVDHSVAQQHYQMCILLSFAGIGLVLACLGIYGVLSFNIGRRTGEIGIRMALGAQPEQMRRMVMRQGMAPVLTGLIAGVLASLALGRLIQSLLFGVEPLDPATYLGASAVLLGVAALACLIPARRAAALNPLEALRTE